MRLAPAHRSMQRRIVGGLSGLTLASVLIASGVYVVMNSRHIRVITPSVPVIRHSSSLSTVKPSPKTVASYTVAPDLPKYLKIPSIGVDTRVFAVGLDRSGAIATPNNVFDTAWYNSSAKPGQPGAMLIDGHISSWTSPGVFYHLMRLRAGDSVQVVRGDNEIFNYTVVKTVIYPSNNVNMQQVLAPVVAGNPGLNLISCAGDVISGTSEFDKRIVVFTEQAQ